MKLIFFNILIFFLIFQNLVLSNVPLPKFISYWDESLLIVLLGYMFLLLNTNKYSIKFKLKKSHLCVSLCMLGIFLSGLLGNILFNYMHSVDAIIRDIVNFSKFPLAYVAIKKLGYDKKIANALTHGGITFAKVMVLIIFVLGIINQFYDIGLSQNEIRYGITPYQFLFSHPTYLTTSNIYLLAILNATESNKRNYFYYIMISVNIVLSMRTKGIVMVAIFVFMKFGGNWLKKIKILYWGAIGGIVIATSYNKLLLYSTFSSSPREAMYKGAFQLLQMCFPIGSGFATYASHLSGKEGSGVYNLIYIPDLWVNGSMSAVIGDAGYPYYIGQFGVIGLVLLGIMIAIMIKSISNENGEVGLSVLVILLYIAIALTSESLLVNNGVETAIVLAVVIKLQKRGTKSELRKR